MALARIACFLIVTLTAGTAFGLAGCRSSPLSSLPPEDPPPVSIAPAETVGEAPAWTPRWDRRTDEEAGAPRKITRKY